MSPLTFIARYRLADADGFRDLARRYRDDLEANHPRLHALAVHVDAEVATLVAVHADRGAMEAHLPRIQDYLGEAAAYGAIESIDVYGEPGPRLRTALERNREEGAVIRVVDAPAIGFTRAA